MRKSVKTVALLLISLLLVACSGQEVTTIPSPQPFSLQTGTNLLTNGDFENGFREYQEIGELKVAEEWTPFWDHNSARPEYRDAAPFKNRIASGEHASQWFNSWDKHTAGIYQTVYGFTVGRSLTFSCMVQAWSTNANDPNHSDGRYRMKLGIDPYGGKDFRSGDIIWSDGGHAKQPYDNYEFLSVETATVSNRVTVFVWGQAEWAVKANNAYVDSCVLSIDGVQPAPTPEPGPTPQPGVIDYEKIRDIVRTELDSTILTGR